MIDHEVRQMLDESRTRVHQDLDTRRSTLEALAALLIEREVVDREALDRLMAAEASKQTVRGGTAAPVAS